MSTPSRQVVYIRVNTAWRFVLMNAREARRQHLRVSRFACSHDNDRKDMRSRYRLSQLVSLLSVINAGVKSDDADGTKHGNIGL